MSIHDYIIDHCNVDWPVVLHGWSWLVPQSFIVWLMNRFGDLFIVLEDGTVHLLDVGGGSLKKVAENRDDFATKLDEGNNANEWLMIPLIDQLVAAGLTLREGECYSYKLPPLLGGGYTVENTFVLSIPKHYGAYASIHNQVKNLREGTRVVINGTK